MERIEEFVRKARYAEHRATEAGTSEERRAYLKIAEGWWRLARRRGLTGNC